MKKINLNTNNPINEVEDFVLDLSDIELMLLQAEREDKREKLINAFVDFHFGGQRKKADKVLRELF